MTGIPSPESEPTSYVAGAVRQAGPRARYFRFQPQVRGVGMIETDEDTLLQMRRCFRENSLLQDANSEKFRSGSQGSILKSRTPILVFVGLFLPF